MLCMDKNMKVHRVYIALTMACLHCIAFIQIVDASFLRYYGSLSSLETFILLP